MIEPHLARPEWASLVELLRFRALEQPNTELFSFLADGEDVATAAFTRGELDRRARALAVRLRDHGLEGQRALLLYPPGLEFIAAFFGCLYAGVVAVPAYLPRLNRPMTRLQSIVADARPSAVLTGSSHVKDSARWSAGVPGLEGVQVLCSDQSTDSDDLAGRWVEPGAATGTLAFLQYTSGSTAIPKGVMITHGNLLDNSARIHEAFGSTPDGRGVFWLPLFHDMGLIGGVIQTLYCGGASTLFSPASFLQRPLRWLQAISRTRAIISGGPNFAYDLCVEKTTLEQRAALDLSCWKVAFNGAEPVRAETLDRFAQAFAPAGFRPEAFLPCYGLAEATLLVSVCPSARAPVVVSVDAESLGRSEVLLAAGSRSATRLVSSGRAAPGYTVAIVDPVTVRFCPEDRVGEIWVSGPSIAQGYWDRPEESREVMGARLIGEDDHSFLRTGDLGFLRDGELFVTGRIKDMMILRGRNVYPQDVEWAAESCHSALRAGGAGAFAIEASGEERLAIVLEVERRLQSGAAEEIFAAVRREVALALDLEVFAIRLIKSTTLPRTSSGKVQRHACREAFVAGSLEIVAEWTRQDAADSPAQSAREPAPAPRRARSSSSGSRDAIVAWLAAKVAEPLGVRADDIDIRAPLASFGIGSLQAVRLAAELEERLGRKLAPTLVYDYPTIDALAGFLAGERTDAAPVRPAGAASNNGREPIALVGIGCRFPGADGPAAFWELLRAGREAIGAVPDARWTEQDLRGLDFPRRSGFLQSIDRFDAAFFHIAPREAIYLDPQQRMLLEVAWEALEDAGQVPDRLAGTAVGVFIGISTNDYAFIQVKRGGAAIGHRVTGNSGSIAANRISHFFDFRAPSVAIDTACSSSLVATLLACRSIWDGESELALAGGSNLLLQAQVFAGFAKSGFLAPDGHCKAFDAQANGYVRGEGVGIVVLKPLSRALADGDPIYAVIRGGALNQDGRTNGLTAPSRPAQEAVLRAAYRHAGMAPGLVDYVEAHGTGTPLGDPIELAALGAVVSEGRDARRKCAVGSVKTNIGHLEAAAGVAGLIKTALALKHRTIPASINYCQPNPHVDFDALPLEVAQRLTPWPNSDGPARAGVSAFGFGGTNAHIVLEEAPRRSQKEARRDSAGPENDEVVIPLSARTPDALWDLCRSFRDFLSNASNDMNLGDVAFTTGARRGHHEHRLALLVSSRDEAIGALDAFGRGEPHWNFVQGRKPRGRRPGIVFVFPGTGGLWQGAGRAHSHREPAFRAAIESCDAILRDHLGWSTADELSADAPVSRIGEPAADRAIQFSLEVALAALWESWGIIPDRVVGDGVGQFAAAYVGGAITLEDAARLVAGKAPETAAVADAIKAVANEGFEVFLEVGAHPALALAIKQNAGGRERAPLVLASLRRGDLGLGTMRSSAASLYARGFDIEWSRVSTPGRCIWLPGYRWQRERFWLDQEDARGTSRAHDELDRRDAISSAQPRPNGRSNEPQQVPGEEGRALVAGHDQPIKRPRATLANGVAAHSGEGAPEGLSALPGDASAQRLVEYFRDRVAAVLGLTPEKVDPDRPLLSLGLDSLSAMDLKMEIDAGLGTKLPLSMLMEGMGIRELAARVSENFPLKRTASSEPPEVDERASATVAADPRLSHGQQMLWYAHQFTTTGAAYHVLGAGRVRAELDIDAFRRALRHVIARQEALRSRFVVVDEKPAVRLLDVSDLANREDEWLTIEDVSDSDDTQLEERLADLARRPFDLERGPLFRIHLLSRSVSEHVALLVFHHIIADFWSAAVFLDDFKKAYSAELAGRSGELPRPLSSYGEFAQWQNEMVASADGHRHWEYWAQQLARPLPVLNLPTDFARPALQTYNGAVKHFDLDPALTQAIIALGESRGASLYTLLLAVFQVLLARYSGQADVIVGTPVAARTRPRVQDLVGYFVNMLPMRADLTGNPPFHEFLGRVRRIVSEALEHQDFPFALLVHRLQNNPDPSRPPVFQVMFAHQKIQPLDEQGLAPFALGIPGARLDLHGLEIESIALERQTALFDLTMMTAIDGDRLRVALEYSTDLFKSSTIERLGDGFRNLLRSVVAHPGRGIMDLGLVSSSARAQLADAWAVAPTVPCEEIAIHHRFERQVRSSRDTLALACGDGSLTYGQLNRMSNLLAHGLIERGVRPETVVGLYLDRWPSRMVAVLGVLKAGAAYLPLDSDHPQERLATMMRESSATVLLTDEHLRDRLPAGPTQVVTIGAVTESSSQFEVQNPGVQVEGENLAYVVFTSGSTGRPKGVMVSHRALLAAATAWEHAYDLRRPPLKHLQAAGFAFDVFTGDWVRALTTGGTLVACPRSVLLDPAELVDLIRRERVECLELVPAIADALADHLERQGEDLRGVRLLAVGSDTLRGRVYRRLRRLIGPGGRVVNSYGLTEATIDSTYFGGPPEELEGADGPVPIGRPLPGTSVYVLDGRGEPVPVGVLGELYVGGSGVARGYVADPRQTGERYIPDPHGAPGSRMYATGDRARWREDGVLELMGRQDGQVKVRGFRVELGEVEGVLARHPHVSESAVAVVDNALGDKRLAAYVVLRALPGPTAPDLQRWLKERIPEPMVPSSYTFLDALPLSPNGKVDRAALPPPDLGADVFATMYVPPRTTAEEILARIAADVLGRNQVGVNDNFFELGVDSIVGIQFVSRARQSGLMLSPADLFRHPSIAELAVAAEASPDHQGVHAKPIPAVAPFELAPEGIDLEAMQRAFADHGEIEDLYPLTPMQEGMLFHALADPEAGHYVEQFVCRVRGELDPSVVAESWNRLVARHAALRSTIHWTDFDRPVQIVHRLAGHSVEFDDWRGLTPAEQDARLTAYLGADRRRGFVSSQPPLSRLAVLTLGENVHQLAWSIHHAVIDGWCLSVLLHEFLDIAEAIRRGQEPELKPVRPFRDYVAWLRGRDHEHAKAYWKQALGGVSAATPLGVEGFSPGPRGMTREAAAERETVLPADVTAGLEAVARSCRITLSSFIHGGWALLLSRYSGRSDVVFGATVSGRAPEIAGVESMVGMFVNVLPLRVTVTEEAQLVPWLRAIQTTMVDLRRFEAIPLSAIQSWSEMPAGTPLFESIVIVQNLPFVGSLRERASGLGFESARYLERTHYPLAVTVVPGAELTIKIGFDSDRFDPSAIERMLGHLRTLLEAMTAQLQGRLIDLPMLSSTEQEQLIERWNGSEGEPPSDDLWLDQMNESELNALIDRLRCDTRNER
jgi:amino acid adenylation domain-containing protein